MLSELQTNEPQITSAAALLCSVSREAFFGLDHQPLDIPPLFLDNPRPITQTGGAMGPIALASRRAVTAPASGRSSRTTSASRSLSISSDFTEQESDEAPTLQRAESYSSLLDANSRTRTASEVTSLTDSTSAEEAPILRRSARISQPTKRKAEAMEQKPITKKPDLSEGPKPILRLKFGNSSAAKPTTQPIKPFKIRLSTEDSFSESSAIGKSTGVKDITKRASIKDEPVVENRIIEESFDEKPIITTQPEKKMKLKLKPNINENPEPKPKPPPKRKVEEIKLPNGGSKYAGLDYDIILT